MSHFAKNENCLADFIFIWNDTVVYGVCLYLNTATGFCFLSCHHCSNWLSLLQGKWSMEQLQNYIYGLILTELRQLQEKNPPPNVKKNEFIVVIRKVTILAIKTQNIFNVWCLHNNMYLYNDFLANLKIGIHLFICSGCT